MSNPYKVKKLGPSVIGLEFKNAKHMALMFMRIQEYTEGKKKVRGKILSEGDTLIYYLKKLKNKLYYTAGWLGFNIKGSTINKAHFNYTSPKRIIWNKYEKELFAICKKHFGSQFDKFSTGQYYVIAWVKGDKATKKHELFHAAFYLNRDYRRKVSSILGKNGLKKARKYLKKMNYRVTKDFEGVYIVTDETNAYAMEENSRKTCRDLGLSKKTQKKLRKLAKEFVL